MLLFILISGVMSYKYKWFLPKIIGLKRFMPDRIKKFVSKFGIDEETIKGFIDNVPSYFSNKGLILLLVALTIIQAVLLPFFVGLSLMFFNVGLSYFDLFVVYWISYILGRLSFLPSGLGVKDVTMGGLLLGFGVNGVTVVKTVILFRVFAFIPYLFIGGLAFLYYGHKYTYKRFFKRDFGEEIKP